jgi:lipoate-protein ligase A
VLLVRDGRRPGAENMAIDEALLERGDPFVRLYGWEPGCVSLGYPQDEDAVNREPIREHGIDFARRPTGGGSIYHARSEVTYAIVLPTDFADLPGDLFEDYRHLSRPVLDTLDDLGLDASFKKAQGGRRDFCYLREAGVSIVDGQGRKISGGAQRRTKHAVLQHGTVIVDRDPELLARVYDETPDAIRAGVGSLRANDVTVDRETLVDRLAQAYVDGIDPDTVTEAGPERLDALADPEPA